MAEENQAQQEPQGEAEQVQQVTKEPQGEATQAQRVTTKNPKKVEASKRLAAHNRRRREEKKREEQTQLEKTTSRVNQYYGIRAVIALGVIGGLGYYIYQSRKGPTPREVTMPISQQPCPQAQPQSNKFEMD